MNRNLLAATDVATKKINEQFPLYEACFMPMGRTPLDLFLFGKFLIRQTALTHGIREDRLDNSVTKSILKRRGE